MERHHFQDADVKFSILTADTSPGDISDPTKILKHNIEEVILTVQNYLMSVLEVTKFSYFIFLPQMLLSPLQVLLYHKSS